MVTKDDLTEMVMSAPIGKHSTSTPKVGSLWKSKDGRFMQVLGTRPGPSCNESSTVLLRVLEPLTHRQRRETTMALSRFGSFLDLITYEQLIKHDPGLGVYDATFLPFIFRFLKGRGQAEIVSEALDMGVSLCFHAVGGPDNNAEFGNSQLLKHVRDNENPAWKEGGMTWIGAWMNEDNEVTSIYAKSAQNV